MKTLYYEKQAIRFAAGGEKKGSKHGKKKWSMRSEVDVEDAKVKGDRERGRKEADNASLAWAVACCIENGDARHFPA